ncbi:MAG TPA: hypothetical protein VMW64_09305 [Dehalococcoidia bacterium]|nr:hypothetical protein [Dehalococcoidia bacterium]
MPDKLADLVVVTLRIVDLVFDIWVDLNAAQALTTEGTSLVQAIADLAVTMANVGVLLTLNSPL